MKKRAQATILNLCPNFFYTKEIPGRNDEKLQNALNII